MGCAATLEYWPVGLIGVSYLAMSQWRVAALKPPSLRAIVPWEGVTDLYREFAYHGGIPETNFLPTWFKFRIRQGRNRRFALAENFLECATAHPFDDEYWASKRADLQAIDVPALVCASWSDHGLHTRGSLEGFRRISSRNKWLFTHGRKKWETFYSDQAKALQLRLLDQFVKQTEAGMGAVPPVRLEVRRSLRKYDVRSEPEWPLESMRPAALYLSSETGLLETVPIAPKAKPSTTRLAEVYTAGLLSLTVSCARWSSPAA